MADRVYYNKLIRDKIPEIIKQAGCESESIVMSDNEFELELLKKVAEEASALPNCKDKNDLTGELADVLAVIEEIKRLKDISDEDISEALRKNFERKGGFEKKLYLVWSSDDGYRTNETTLDVKNN